MAGVSRRYGSTVAVSNFSLEVSSGEIVGLLGPKGAGKSTVLHMLCGLVRPNAGEICLFGKELRKHFIEIAPRIGVMLEHPAFIEHLSIRRNLKLQARLARQPVNVDRILGMTGLLDYASERAGSLSRELRQRLALAQAMLTEPELLLLDEPANGLDAESAIELFEMLRHLAKDAKVSILFASHLLHEVEGICDRVVFMFEGQVTPVETTNRLFSYDTSRIEVLTSHPERAMKRLTGQPWLRRAELKNGHLYAWVENGAAHHLTALLLASGIQVMGIIPQRRTLNDFFLRVVNRAATGTDDAADA